MSRQRAIDPQDAYFRDLARAKAKWGRRPAGRNASRNELVERNLPLAVDVAHRYVGQGIPLDDLIQVANLALIRAVETFDSTRGTKLSTHLYCQMRFAVLDALNTAGEVVCFPKSIAGKAARKRQRVRSLEHPVTDDDGRTLRVGETLPDDACGDPADTALAGEPPAVELGRYLDQLTPRYRWVIDGRLAGRSLGRLAAEAGLTRERIRQIEQKAIERLFAVCGRRHNGMTMTSLRLVKRVAPSNSPVEKEAACA